MNGLFSVGLQGFFILKFSAATADKLRLGVCCTQLNFLDHAIHLHIPRMSATQSMGRLPLSPPEACHPIHRKVAT
jgi:hypothetical protein